MQTVFKSRSPEETRGFGARLARELVEAVGSAVVALTGELGAGKTTFVQGAARGLGVGQGPASQDRALQRRASQCRPVGGRLFDEGVGEAVRSPTFVLVREHEGKGGRLLVHVDACRLRSAEELRDVGSDDFLPPRPSTDSTGSTGSTGPEGGGGVAFVEWAGNVEAALPRPYLALDFRHVSEDTREIEVRGVGEGAELLVEAAVRAAR